METQKDKLDFRTIRVSLREYENIHTNLISYKIQLKKMKNDYRVRVNNEYVNTLTILWEKNLDYCKFCFM